jgi:hypothetical protein
MPFTPWTEQCPRERLGTEQSVGAQNSLGLWRGDYFWEMTKSVTVVCPGLIVTDCFQVLGSLKTAR